MVFCNKADEFENDFLVFLEKKCVFRVNLHQKTHFFAKKWQKSAKCTKLYTKTLKKPLTNSLK